MHRILQDFSAMKFICSLFDVYLGKFESILPGRELNKNKFFRFTGSANFRILFKVTLHKTVEQFLNNLFVKPYVNNMLIDYVGSAKMTEVVTLCNSS